MNKKRFLTFAVAIMFLALVPVVAGASTITFTSAPVSAYGFGVGLYYGTVDGVDALFVCDDFFTDIGGGQSWHANDGVTDPSSPTNMFTGAGAFLPFPISGTLTTQQDYNMLGFLADKIFADPTDAGGQWGVDSFAIWSLNDSAAYTSYAQSQGIGGAVSSLLSSAYANKNNPTDLTVYTPDPWNTGQEFLSPAVATPEPPGFSLMFIGAACIVAGKFRHKRIS